MRRGKTLSPEGHRFNGNRRKNLTNVWCKCPYCQKMHQKRFDSIPIVMPRIYCREHEYLRTDSGEYMTYNKRQKAKVAR